MTSEVLRKILVAGAAVAALSVAARRKPAEILVGPSDGWGGNSTPKRIDPG